MAKEIGQLNVKIALDATGFQNGISNLNREMKVLKSEFRLASTEMGKHGKELDSLKLKADSLSKQTEIQKQRVEALEAAHQKSVEIKGADAKATQNLEIKLNKAKTQLVKMEQDLTKLNQQIEIQSTSWGKLSKTLGNIGASMQDMGRKMVSVGKDLSVKVTAPIVGLGTAAFAAADSVKGATDIIRQSTGATGKDFEELKDSFKTVFADAPDSAETVAATLSNLNTFTGVTGKELEKLTTLTLDYAKVNRTDAAASAEVLGRLMNALEVDIAQLPGVMDKLTKASQMSGLGVDQLANYVIEAGPAFEEMGFGLDRSIALFAQFHKTGANPRETLSSLNKVLNTMAKEGATNAEEAFKILLQRIKDAPDILTATTIASEAFGSRVGAKVAEDIRAGKFEVNAWVEALQNADGTIQTTAAETGKFSEKLSIFKNKATLAFGPLGDPIIAAMSGALDAMRPLISAVGNLAQRFAELNPGTQEAIIKIVALVAAIGPAMIIGGKFAMALGTVSIAFSTVSGAIAVITTGAVAATPVIGALATAFTVLTGPIGLVTATIAGITVAGVALHKHLSQDSIPAIKLFGDEVSESTREAVGGFLELNDQATLSLNQLSWSGQEVTKDMAGKIAGNFSQMAAQIQAKLDDHHKASLEKIEGFVTRSTSLSKQEQEEILDNMQKGHESRRQVVADGEVRIKEILNTASSEKRALTKAEQEEINTIQKTMVETGVKVLSENEVEAKAIMERMKAQAGDITAKQAAEVVKNSLEQKDGAIKAAEEQYNEVVKEIIRQRDETGVISKDQADKLIQEATRQKDEAIARAEQMHLNVVKEAKAQAAEHINQVDWETGEIKTKWQAMKDDIAAKAQGIKDTVSQKWEEIKARSAEAWQSIHNDTQRIWNNIKTEVSGIAQGIKDTVSQKWEEIKATTLQIWENLRNQTITWGRNIVQGLADGIREKIQTAISAVGEVVAGVKDKVTSMLGIHSPSQVMAEYGKNIDEGLAKGINEHFGVIETAMGLVVTGVQGKVKEALQFIEGLRQEASKPIIMGGVMYRPTGATAGAGGTGGLDDVGTPGNVTTFLATDGEWYTTVTDSTGSTYTIKGKGEGIQYTNDFPIEFVEPGKINVPGIGIVDVTDKAQNAWEHYKGSSGGGGGGGSSSEWGSGGDYTGSEGTGTGQYTGGFEVVDKGDSYYVPGIGDVPKKAEGGVLTKPQFIFGGEAGDEAILPLERLQPMLNTALLDAIKNMLVGIAPGKETNYRDEILRQGRGITQYITINSPTPLTPSETARQIKNASRQLAMEW